MPIDPITIQALQQNPFNEGRQEFQRINIDGIGDSSFADMVKDAINSVDEMQKVTDKGVEDILAGKAENIHEVMIAMEKAQLSFQLMVEIRNKVMDTYQELSRMQI
ncbi:MAG: flagellar hook-basal body complex protein FliE [Balneolaceae bacterium]